MTPSEPREDAVAAHLKVLREIRANLGTTPRPIEKPDADALDAAIAALAQQGAEAVAWQCRHRASKAEPWGEWEGCDHNSYVGITRSQSVMWEARALVPATGAPR